MSHQLITLEAIYVLLSVVLLVKLPVCGMYIAIVLCAYSKTIGTYMCMHSVIIKANGI